MTDAPNPTGEATKTPVSAGAPVPATDRQMCAPALTVEDELVKMWSFLIVQATGITVARPMNVFSPTVGWLLPLSGAHIPVVVELSVTLAVNTNPVEAPAGPVGPVAPVAPVAPAGPAGPAAPVAPVAPAGPAGPIAPVSPFAPVSPIVP